MDRYESDQRTTMLGAIEKRFAAERGGKTTKRDAIRAAEATIRAACADTAYDSATCRSLLRLAILRVHA